MPNEDQLTHRIEELAAKYGRYGTPRITAMLHREGYTVNHKRVERIREQGLKVPKKQIKRARLWSDGSCIRLRAEHKDHVWSYDMVEDKTHDGKKSRILNIIDEYSRECLMVFVSRHIRSIEVKECLIELFIQRGMPPNIFALIMVANLSQKKFKNFYLGLEHSQHISSLEVLGKMVMSNHLTGRCGMSC